jgi:flavin-dependent dehydrogenase
VTQTAVVDVAVLGGGLAGLTVAMQLKRLRPATSVVVLEKREHPVPATAYKVGESIAEVAAFYLKDTIGLEDYLRENHLRKMGLRTFCSAGDNTDLTRRVEFGAMRYSPLMNYHLDRGMIENDLVDLAVGAGVELRDRTTVRTVELSEDDGPHTITIGERPDAADERVQARWVIDATGRAGLLRRKLGLGYELPIDVNSCWFRVADRLELDQWTDDYAWRSLVPDENRWKSTTSFVGEGYWIWIINLGSGATSVGIVADPRHHPFERIRRYDAALEWMREQEPLLARHLPADEAELLDFEKVKGYSYGISRTFHKRRWCIVGEAALFLDPLYSTGHDFTAIGNTLATDIISHALDEEPTPELNKRIRMHNRFFLSMAASEISVFHDQLDVYRDAQATGAKFLWDNTTYFSILLLLFRNELMTDIDFMRSMQGMLELNTRINDYTQSCFAQWSREDFDATAAGIPVKTDFLASELFNTPLYDLSPEETRERIVLGIRRLHTISREMVTRFYEAAGRPVPPCPYDAIEPVDEDLVMWTDCDDRVRPTELREPQPAGGWFLR